MELFLVLLAFSILIFAMSKILISSVKLFDEREKYKTKAVIDKVEYRKNSDTTIYHVTFTNKNGDSQKGKSIQYKGKPIYNEGNLVDIYHLIRDEMKNLINNELVEVINENHKSMTEDLTPKLKKLNYISVLFLVLSIIALIKWLIF